MEAEFSNARLTGSRWSLGAEGRVPWSSNIHFLPSGRIGGYSSPNEVYWSLEHVVLRIFRSNHQEMWRFTEPHLVDGLWQATAASHAAPDLHTPCRLKEVEKPCTIVPKEADLVASRWSLAEAGKPPWSSSLYFLTDGSIGGYSSPNEVYWSLTDSVLRIFRGNRQEMWRFGDFELIDGKLSVVGSYQAEPNVALLCQLTQLERRPEAQPAGAEPNATEVLLAGSRWSLGVAGEEPWSASVYFLRNGRIGGYKSSEEAHWKLEHSVLWICSAERRETWRFGELTTANGKLQATGVSQNDQVHQRVCVLAEQSKFSATA